MDKGRKVARRRELRKKTTSNIRKVLFVADYIECKYSNIYAEAVEFYNTMDTQYSDKRDLRKTAIYKDWKIRVANQKVPQQDHLNIEPILPHSPAQPSVSSTEDSTEESPPQSPCEDRAASSSQHVYRDNLQLRIPLIPYE